MTTTTPMSDVATAEPRDRIGDDRQRIADLVRDDCRELADRGKLLPAGQLALSFSKLFVGLL